MFDRAEIKQQARRNLKGIWLKGFCVYYIYAMIKLLPYLLNSVNAVMTQSYVSLYLGMWDIRIVLLRFLLPFVSLPLSVSIYLYFMQLYRGGNPAFGVGFRAFSANPGYVNCLKATLWVSMWLMLWFLLVLPPIIIGAISVFRLGVLGSLFGLLLICAAFIVYFMKAYSYALVPMIIADYPQIGARKALTMSIVMMKGYRWELFVFNLSFLLWELLVVCTLCIASIYAWPYMMTAMAGAYDKIKELGEQDGRLEGFYKTERPLSNTPDLV